MTTTITLPTQEYNRAKAYAEEQNLSMDELFAMLINQMTFEEDSFDLPDFGLFNPFEHTQEELDARFDEIEKECENEEGIPHEQMMAELKKEFPWLQ